MKRTEGYRSSEKSKMMRIIIISKAEQDGRKTMGREAKERTGRCYTPKLNTMLNRLSVEANTGAHSSSLSSPSPSSSASESTTTKSDKLPSSLSCPSSIPSMDSASDPSSEG